MKKHGRKEKNKKKILEGLLDGKTLEEIENSVTIRSVQIGRIRDQLIEERQITEDEIKEARRKAREEKKKEKRKKLQKENGENLDEEKLLEYLILGYDLNKIKRKMEIKNIENYHLAVEALVEKGKITEEEIEAYRKKREEEDKTIILQELKQGNSISGIADMIDNTMHITKKYIEAIKDEKNISDEDILQWRKEREARRKESTDNIKEEELLKYLLLGYDLNKIKRKMDIVKIDNLRKAIAKLVDQGDITREEIEAYRENREREDKNKVLDELKKGSTIEEIANVIENEVYMVQKYVETLNVSDEDILSWRKKRKLREEGIIDIDIERLLEYLILGYDIEKIKREMKIVKIDNINKAITKLVDRGDITREEIEAYRENREREEIEEVLKKFGAGSTKIEIANAIENTLHMVKKYIETVQTEEDISKEEEENSEEIRQKTEEEKNQRIKRKIDQLKREIETELKLGREPSEEKKEKMRRCANLYYEKYAKEKEKITKPELMFLKQIFNKIAIKENDMIKFANYAIVLGEYKEGLDFVRYAKEVQTGNFTKSQKEKAEKLEEILSKANQVQQVLQMMSRGNNNAAILANVTGLSKDEVNILKIRVQGQPIRIAGEIKRKKILDILVADKDPVKIQKEMGISDFEMDDMIEQMMEYRQQKNRYKNSNTEEEKEKIRKQIWRDIRTRIIVLYTKLGKNPEFIAKVLKKPPETIEKNLSYAIKREWIQKEQLQGIDPLVSCQNALREQVK